MFPITGVDQLQNTLEGVKAGSVGANTSHRISVLHTLCTARYEKSIGKKHWLTQGLGCLGVCVCVCVFVCVRGSSLRSHAP